MSADGVPSAEEKFVGVFHNRITAWLILAVSLCLTIVAYLISAKFVEQKARVQFEYRAEEIEQAIKDRLEVYEQVLWGGGSHVLG